MSKLQTSQNRKRIAFLFSLFFILSINCIAQQRTIKGQVIDGSSNEPLIGVSVFEKGTTNGSVSDLDGNFTINVSSSKSIIQFSFIGYVSQEIKADKSNVKIILKEDNKTLDEVVVVGYGIQKKVNLSGAVSAIKGDAISAKASTDVLSALQGEMPGVTVLRSSGEPGSETSGMRIRGFSSTNSTKTLVLIDGIEGDLTLLNPDEVESISVLKDAAACAIYGARAASGVVLVTTKGGVEGKAKVTYNGSFSINTPGNMPERLPAWEEQDFINISRINASGKPEWNEEQSSWIGNPNFNYRPNGSNGRWDFFQATNWINEGVKDYTTQQSHSVTVSGGNKSLNYLISAGFYTKDGLLKYGPDNYDRYNLRAKVTTEINKYLDFTLNASYQGTEREENPYGAGNILERLFRVRGRQPIYNPEEDINESPYNGDLQQNAIDIMKNGGINKQHFENYTAKGTLTIQDVIKGVRINLSASRRAGYWSMENQKRNLIWYDRLGTGIRFQINNPNSLTKKKNSETQDLLEATINYDLNIDKHSINLLAGSTYENYRKDEISATATNLNSNDFFSFNYYDSSLAENTNISDNIEPWSMMSYFGRINYSFSDRYLFEANIRYDGSSRLAPSHRWKAFPSFSAAWRINEEKWFKVKPISNLKLRASWGQLGNGAVLGLYDYIALIESGTHLGEGYYYQKELASSEKTWETIETTNIGLDLGMLNNKLNFTADYYWKYNNDMLANLQLPHTIGVGVPTANVGKLKTWGWELSLGWKDKIGNVDYQVNFNLSDSENKLMKYDGVSTVKEGSITLLEGYPLNTIWGYKTDGYWKSRDEYLAYKEANPGYKTFQDGKIAGGDVKYVALGAQDHIIGAGNGVPGDSGDLVYLGNSNGRYLYGINLSAQWKNFDISAMFQGVGKRDILINSGTMAPLSQSSLMPWTIHRDYWTEDNQDAYWPRLYNYNNGEAFNFHASDKWLQDASYIRLKNLTIGYTIPISKSIVDKLRVYVIGTDLWEHSNLLNVFDPEVGNNASANYYPFFRTYSVGVNVVF